MKITLPSSREKHYLTGMDWMIHALDHSSRKRLGCGTAFQIVMELSSPLHSSLLEKHLAGYCGRFLHLNGKLARDWNLAPYWKRQPPNRSFHLKLLSASNPEDAYRKLEEELNQPAEKDAFPLRVIYIETPQNKWLGFIFDHRLFDARGAERFLQGFQTYYLALGNAAEANLSPAGAHLDQWSEQFAAGKKVNRSRIAAGKGSGLRLLREPATFKGTRNLFKVKTFDEEQTRAIAQRAGSFMFLPYSLAVSIQKMHALFLERGADQGDLSVSVTHDMRPSHGSLPSETFFNHLSFMFFRVMASEAMNLDPLIAKLKNQFYEQVKNKMPKALADASMLMRIVPLRVMSYGLQMREYAPASFSFASLGESAYLYEDFMEANVERLFHMPRVPPLPGLGIFFSQYKKKLNMTLSYLDSLINEQEACSLMNELSRL